MKEDWLKDIHDCMIDYEMNEPVGLWEDICKAQENKTSRRHSFLIQSVRRRWARHISIVAAVIIVVVLIGIHRHITPDVPSISSQKEISRWRNTGDVKIASGSLVAACHNLPLHSGNHLIAVADTAPAVSVPMTPITSDSVLVASQKGCDSEKHSNSSEAQFSDSENNGGEHILPRSDELVLFTTRKKRSSRFTFGVFTAGESGSSIHRKNMGDSFVTSIGTDNYEWDDSPLLGILLYNQGQEVKTEIKHHLPVRFGVSLGTNIDRRFSVESGIIYTRLSSDVREGSRHHYFTGEQTLQYVGIPLNLKCRLLSWKAFDVYTSSGVLLEKCVSAILRKEYILNSQTKETETEHIGDKPLQCSVNVAAGVQYGITPTMSVYAEPGLGYYFGDGSSIKTIYKDKPLNFCLNLGLRFTLNNKR